MTSAQSAIDVYLRADSTLMNYIGGVGAPTPTVGRLYYMLAMECATLPYIVYTMVSNTDSQEFFEKDDTQARIQFDVVASSRASYAIDDRLRTLLRYHSGTISGLTAWMIEPANRRERYNPDTARYVFSSDYIVKAHS
jgi:hypothetical protein